MGKVSGAGFAAERGVCYRYARRYIVMIGNNGSTWVTWSRGVSARVALLFALVATVPLGGVGLSTAQAAEESTQSKVLAVGASAVYLPAKVFYALFGGATAGLAWGFTLGNEELSNQIWVAAVEGTYVVTPAMVEGREEVRFKGP